MLGLVGFFTSILFIPSVLAVIYGVMGRAEVKRGASGGAMAVWGIVLGVLGILLGVLFWVDASILELEM